MRNSTAKRLKTEKVVMLGAASTGKTSLVTRFAHDRFMQNSESTIGAAFVSKVIKVGEKDVKLEIWDTGGSEKYRSLAPMYYRDTHSAIIVFDLTVASTLDDAQMWIDELRERGPSHVILACAANKADLTVERVIDDQKLKAFIEKNQIEIVKETSALNGTNVVELFTQMTEAMLKSAVPELEDDTVQLEPKPKTEEAKAGCGC